MMVCFGDAEGIIINTKGEIVGIRPTGCYEFANRIRMKDKNGVEKEAHLFIYLTCQKVKPNLMKAF